MIDKINISTDEILRDIAVESDIATDWYQTDDYYQWYYSYGYNFKPKSYLEFGLRYGYSMAAVMRGAFAADIYVEYASAVDAEVYGVNDTNIIAQNILNKIFPELKFEIFKESTANFDITKLQLKQYDMIHLDASHDSKGVLIELEKTWPILKINGILIVDDVFSKVSPEKCTFEVHRMLLSWVLSDLNNIKKYCYINNLRGHFLLMKG